jgi:hypothetical protein
MYDFFFVRVIQNNETKSKIVDFLDKQNVWMRGEINKRSDPIWRHVSYVISQYDGVIDGYRSAASDLKVMKKKACFKHKIKNIFALKLRNVTNLEFDIMNDSGDLLDLQSAVNPADRPNIKKMKKHELDAYLLKTTHCSALIKV